MVIYFSFPCQEFDDSLEGFDLVSRLQPLDDRFIMAKWLPSTIPYDPSSLHRFIVSVCLSGQLGLFDGNGALLMSLPAGHQAPVTGKNALSVYPPDPTRATSSFSLPRA